MCRPVLLCAVLDICTSPPVRACFVCIALCCPHVALPAFTFLRVRLPTLSETALLPVFCSHLVSVHAVGAPGIVSVNGVCVASCSDDPGRLLALVVQRQTTLVLVIVSAQLVPLGEAVISRADACSAVNLTSCVKVLWSPDSRVVLVWRSDGTRRSSVWQVDEMGDEDSVVGSTLAVPEWCDHTPASAPRRDSCRALRVSAFETPPHPFHDANAVCRYGSAGVLVATGNDLLSLCSWRGLTLAQYVIAHRPVGSASALSSASTVPSAFSAASHKGVSSNEIHGWVRDMTACRQLKVVAMLFSSGRLFAVPLLPVKRVACSSGSGSSGSTSIASSNSIGAPMAVSPSNTSTFQSSTAVMGSDGAVAAVASTAVRSLSFLRTALFQRFSPSENPVVVKAEMSSPLQPVTSSPSVSLPSTASPAGPGTGVLPSAAATSPSNVHAFTARQRCKPKELFLNRDHLGDVCSLSFSHNSCALAVGFAGGDVQVLQFDCRLSAGRGTEGRAAVSSASTSLPLHSARPMSFPVPPPPPPPSSLPSAATTAPAAEPRTLKRPHVTVRIRTTLSLASWGASPLKTGAVSVVRWGPRDDVIAVGHALHGVTVWSLDGCRLFCTVNESSDPRAGPDGVDGENCERRSAAINGNAGSSPDLAKVGCLNAAGTRVVESSDRGSDDNDDDNSSDGDDGWQDVLSPSAVSKADTSRPGSCGVHALDWVNEGYTLVCVPALSSSALCMPLPVAAHAWHAAVDLTSGQSPQSTTSSNLYLNTAHSPQAYTPHSLAYASNTVSPVVSVSFMASSTATQGPMAASASLWFTSWDAVYTLLTTNGTNACVGRAITNECSHVDSGTGEESSEVCDSIEVRWMVAAVHAAYGAANTPIRLLSTNDVAQVRFDLLRGYDGNHGVATVIALSRWPLL